MNPYDLLSFPLPKVLRVIARENYKTRVCSTYVPKLNMNKEQLMVSISNIHFNDIRIRIRINLDLPMIE